MAAEFAQDYRFGLFQNLRRADRSDVHFPWPRAVPEFQPERQELLADAFFNQRFAEPGDAIGAQRKGRRWCELLQNRQHLLPKHGVQLARRPWEEKKVWGKPGGVCRQIEPGRGAVIIGEHGRCARALGLQRRHAG